MDVSADGVHVVLIMTIMGVIFVVSIISTMMTNDDGDSDKFDGLEISRYTL